MTDGKGTSGTPKHSFVSFAVLAGTLQLPFAWCVGSAPKTPPEHDS